MVACTIPMHFLLYSIICPKISICTLFTGRKEYNSSDKCHANMNIIEILLHIGASEILRRINNTRMKCILLETIYEKVHPIHCFFLDNFRDNVFVKNGLEWITTTLGETNLLHDS